MSIVNLAAERAPQPSDFAGLTSLPQTALDAIPAAVYVCAADGQVVRHNARAAALWGREPSPGDTDERFCGAFRLYRLDGSDLPPAETPMAGVLRTGESAHDVEIVIERPDGARITALANIDPLIGPGGVVEGAVNCLTDITARKASEQRLAESERRAREVMDALPAALYTTDSRGRITFYNEAAAELWGCRPTLGESEWCGSWKLYWPDGEPLPHDQCPMALALKENHAIRGVEAVAERPDGARVPFAPYPTPLHDAQGNLIGAVNMLIDLSDQKAAQASQGLLINELNHRVKNSLAGVQSIVAQTLRRAGTLEEARPAVEARLAALARAHDLLTRGAWRGADLGELVRVSLAAHCDDPERLTVCGPQVRLSPKLTLSLAMALHELCDNARRHGALSNDPGRISVTWSVETREGVEHLALDWRERGGPPATAPDRRGFGSRIIEWGLSGETGGAAGMDFRPEGLTCHIDLPISSRA